MLSTECTEEQKRYNKNRCWNHQWKKRMLVLRGEQVPTVVFKAQKVGA